MENRHDATDLRDYFRHEDEAWDARPKPSGAAWGLLCALSGALVGVLAGAAGMWWWLSWTA